MKVLIGVMVATLAICVVLIAPDAGAVLRGLTPDMPRGSAAAVLSLMGGVGGSVTLLSYGYWIRERGWSSVGALPRVRIDLAVGYAVTGLFGAAMLGVWQGVPYLFTDFVASMRGRVGPVDVTGPIYRGYLLYLAVPPMAVLFLGRPIWVVKLYTLTGGLFMPVLAGSLLWLNTRRRHLGAVRNGALVNAALVAALALFVAIAVRQFLDVLG